MAVRVAQWVLAALYLAVAAIAIWLGVVTLNPPPEGQQQYIPEVNSAAMTTAVFAFACAALFLAAVGFAIVLLLVVVATIVGNLLGLQVYRLLFRSSSGGPLEKEKKDEKK
jgi:predicted permease